MSNPARYSTAQITLHWLTALAVLIAFFTHDAMEDAVRQLRDTGGGPYPTPHTIAGFTVLILVLVRLWLRRRHGAPEPQGTAQAQRAAIWGHRLIYLLLIAAPVLGMLTWFGGIRALGDLHGLAGQGLMLLALGHAAMALWHHYGKKDGTLTRMIPPLK